MDCFSWLWGRLGGKLVVVVVEEGFWFHEAREEVENGSGGVMGPRRRREAVYFWSWGSASGSVSKGSIECRKEELGRL
jgi:hypothetical protein